MKTFTVTLEIGVPDDVLNPSQWNWETLINSLDNAEEDYTPTKFISAVLRNEYFPSSHSLVVGTAIIDGDTYTALRSDRCAGCHFDTQPGDCDDRDCAADSPFGAPVIFVPLTFKE